MKHLLILLCVTTLVSCGIKNKLLNSSGGTLGVSKQPTVDTAQVDTTQVDTNIVVSQPTPVPSDKTEPTPVESSDESFANWYYVLPFVGLAILGLLVYRLKQQNLKSL